jgi:hypothetical protein
MRKFYVEITQILCKTVEVRAENESEAIREAMKQHAEGEIWIDSSNINTTQYDLIEED